MKKKVIIEGLNLQQTDVIQKNYNNYLLLLQKRTNPKTETLLTSLQQIDDLIYSDLKDLIKNIKMLTKHHDKKIQKAASALCETLSILDNKTKENYKKERLHLQALIEKLLVEHKNQLQTCNLTAWVLMLKDENELFLSTISSELIFA